MNRGKIRVYKESRLDRQWDKTREEGRRTTRTKQTTEEGPNRKIKQE